MIYWISLHIFPMKHAVAEKTSRPPSTFLCILALYIDSPYLRPFRDYA
jgi:hypothetical protein